MRVPRGVIFIVIGLVALTLLPLGVIAVARTSTSTKPRIHPVLDMDVQESFRAQEASTLFADGRAMRAAPEGTIAHGRLGTDRHYLYGRVADAFAKEFPARVDITADVLSRGRRMFNVFCAPCHGRAGYGDGLVAALAGAGERARELEAVGFDGVFTFEGPHDVFVPLALAAAGP